MAAMEYATLKNGKKPIGLGSEDELSMPLRGVQLKKANADLMASAALRGRDWEGPGKQWQLGGRAHLPARGLPRRERRLSRFGDWHCRRLQCQSTKRERRRSRRGSPRAGRCA